ncbi:MAG: DUF488 domain-containing protein [Thermoplasmata archaeon]
MGNIIIWRIYEKPIPEGYKILVDRLWPRGVNKSEIDLWAKEIAPSDDLRKWFSHDKLKWYEFLEKYEIELNNNPDFQKFFNKIQEMLRIKDIIFLYASKEKEFNNANALKIIIEKKFKQ